MAEYPTVTEPYPPNGPEVTVYGGDCLAVLRSMPDASVHAIVTDPPYGLSEVSSAKLTTALTAWVNGDRDRVPGGKGFMGKEWDAFVPPPAVFDECMRVLKPGGHMLVFAGSRTVDLMGLSIRLAGFEIRDTLQWLYGSGFPKSHNVHKSTGDDRFEGWGTALKPAAEPIILARKPLESTVAKNVLAHGTGGINVDGCRVDGGARPLIVSKTETSTGIYGDGLNGSSHGGETAQGRFPANVLLTHNPDCDTECDGGCPVAELDAQSGNRPGAVSNGSKTLEGMNGTSTFKIRQREQVAGYADQGGASRFFPTFRYQAKAPKSERPKVDGVSHPTVKPVALMRWLVRLVTPPGGTVLDPFAGSGTTLQAAQEGGFSVVGIEREAEYWPLIEHRTGVAVTPYVVEAEPGPVDIFEAACAVHGPHPGTADCPTCMETINKIVGNVLAVTTDKALSPIPGMNRIEEQALAAETVVDAELARDALRDLLTEFQTSSQPA